MDAALAALPDDVDALKAALLAARADVAAARAEQSSNLALIAHLKLQIEKLNRDVRIRRGPCRRLGQAAAALFLVALFQFQGSNSCSLEAGWSAMRRRTSANQVRGSTPLSLAVMIRV